MQKQFMGVAALGAALAVADAGHAQAVQWRVEDGGNGHWFELVHSPKPAELARSAAGASGGALAVVRSHAQTAFLVQRLFPSSPANSAWIGGFQDFASSDYSEPAGGWMWVDGTPIAGYTNWDPVWTEPNNANTQEDWVEIARHGTWNDASRLLERSFIVEWSADCNKDGIIDYGQCRDGSLPDYNGNDVPDCCESEMPCETSNYAVQWRIEDGGNGRWYQALLTSAPILWSDARDAARSRGGRLISVNSAEEQAFIEPLLTAAVDPEGCNPALFMGLTKVQGQPWRWEDGTVPGFTNWACGEPADPDYLEGKMVMFNPAACEPYCVPHLRWNDIRLDDLHPLHRGMVIEWSADCNDDGIVDYGQILQGQLPDTNQNGVPDSCETPDCTSADLFRDFNVNGADLGILLAQWGPVNSLTVSDLNNDGAVDGSDLGLLLSFWGPCPG